MKLWLQIILEWLNCLDVSETNIKSLKELEDGKFYKKLIEIISWKNDKDILDTEDIITKFLQDEYPEFKFDNENSGETEQLYIASLFLLYVSQEPLFHEPMCIRLRHETQLKIKTFLEMTIPYGKGIKRETIREMILELEDVSSTPKTPKTRTLKHFFNSPVAMSAQKHKLLTERNRELRKLRNELEMERFEKGDLQEDLRMQQNKVQNLQKKLQEKVAEIKALREEMFQPSTPQSCKKNQNVTDFKQYYRKEVDLLENQLVQKQCEINKLEMDNETLLKKLTYAEKQSLYFKEKLENCEKSLENLQVQGEIRDNELVNLRITNEELRTHLSELNKTAVHEKSFEIDGIAPLNTTLSPLNNSEALSSVIEIQLQEAKEESASLKTQLDIVSKKFESTNLDYKNTAELLKNKTLFLQDTEAKLYSTVNKFSKEIESLQKENTSLIDENKELKDLCASQKESLSEIEKTKDVLSREINTLQGKMKNLEESLHSEGVNTVKLNTSLTEAKLQIDKSSKCIQDLSHQNDLYKTSIECCNTNLKAIIRHNSEAESIDNNNLDVAETSQLVEYVQTILYNFKKKYSSKEVELQSLNAAIEGTKLKLQHSQTQVLELEEKNKQNVTEITKLEGTIAQNVTQINELLTTTHKYSEEISHLKQIQIEKNDLEKELCTCKKEMSEKHSLVMSLVSCIEILKGNLQGFVTEFNMLKKDVVNQLNEYRKQNDKTIKNISNKYQTLCSNFAKEQNCRKELEIKLADTEQDLEDSCNISNTLKNNLAQSNQTINNLETDLINSNEKLEACVKKLEDLQEIKDAVEKQNKNLKLQNEEILHNVNNIKHKFQSSENEVSNLSEQLKFKDERIGHLIAEITSLKLDKEHLNHVQMEGESKLKNFIKELEIKLLKQQRDLDELNIEIKCKEETLKLVQEKFQKQSKEAIASEMKMKEVIMNLQEVRRNQDAVLTTQEKALQEKCLHLEQLQNEFRDFKSALCKQLEDEKSLRKNLQSKNSELQIQSYKQTKGIEELQEVLKRERNELDKNKERYKTEDTKKSEIIHICKELEQLTNDLKLTLVEANPSNEHFYADVIYDVSCTNDDDKTNNILNIVKSSINEIHASRKLILHLYDTNANLNETLQNQKVIVDNYVAKCEEIKKLKEEVQNLKSVEEKRLQHLHNFTKYKESLRDSIQSVMKSREDVDSSLKELRQKWDKLITTFYTILMYDRSVCDELKHIQAQKAHFENVLSKYNVCHLENIQPLYTILYQKLLWTEERLEKIYLHPTSNEQSLDTSNIFSDEKTVIEAELRKNTTLQNEIIQSQKEVEDFFNLVTSFESNSKSDETKFQSEVERKLHFQINELIEEKENLRSKLDCTRMKISKSEGHIDELRSKIQELKVTSSKDIEDLKKELMRAKEENLKIQEERDELNKRPKKEDVDNQLKDIHDKYKVKLDEIKQNMKTAYNEQITKLNKDQEQSIQERWESLQKKMEQQCRKQADELSKYKAHVSSLSSQIWNVGEKLLTEQQEKEKLQKELIELKTKYQNLDPQVVSCIEQKTTKYERKDLLSGEKKEEVLHKIAVIQEKATYERRYSIKSIQAMGNAFNAEDEEGELFDNIYLADMKDGNSTLSSDADRVSILKKRNALCKPHLKSSYPAEMQFHQFTEEEIKTGAPDDIFNDSLSQSLLPEQKAKKKDRTQTSYKKPGPPTPSKNGGRLSLQSTNELRSPNTRILRERNKDRATATPRTLKSLFTSKRQDENVTVTPRERRRSSIFRKYRVQ